MKTVEEPAAFAILEIGVCEHCQRAIERRRMLGWVHVFGFFSCGKAVNGVFSDAKPK